MSDVPFPIAHAIQFVGAAKSRLLKTLSYVPDDRLAWSPAPNAKSALRLASHCACSNRNFLMVVSGQKGPEMTREEAMTAMLNAELSITTREQAIEMIESSTAAFLEHIKTMKAEELDAVVETPMFTAPMTFWLNLPARHMDNHASQIDYLQTCWDDLVWHI